MKIVRIMKSCQPRGFTLIELMTAVALFVIVMVVATALFNRSIESQTDTVASKNIYESGDYALRYMSAEFSGAREELAGCGPCDLNTRYFCIDAGKIYFRNKDSVCENFELQSDEDSVSRLTLVRGAENLFLTDSSVSVTELVFDSQVLSDPVYPSNKVSVHFKIGPSIGSTVKPLDLQTTIATTAEPFVCGQNILDRDNYSYPTVQIDDQCWLGANLRTKTKADGTCINDGFTIPCADASASDDNLGRSCYDNNEANCTSDGALYTWTGAMSPSLNEGDQGICPLGWHIPTAAEWHELEYFFVDGNNTCDPDRDNIEDCSPAGTRLQEAAATDFAALLAGYREAGSSFNERGNNGEFWTSTEGVNDDARQYTISGSSDLVNRRLMEKIQSSSVRCLKN